MQNFSESEKQMLSSFDTLQSGSEGESAIKISDSESIHYDGRHYDLIYDNFYPIPNLTKLDLSFWIDMANQYGDPVLELCCGTGRIALPLAEKGWKVTGIDISESMLEEARKKSSQVKWLKADARNFDLVQKFSLIIFSANSIYHLLNIDDLASCLNCVRKHLKPEGRFVIDTFNFYTKEILEEMWSQSRSLFSVYPDPDGKGTVVVTTVDEFDLTKQICKQKLFFRLLGQEKEFLEEVKFRFYHPNELEALLNYNGFAVESQLGSYDRAPFTSKSPNHIIISKLRE